MRCAAFIFARGGSKGVKRKNIREFAGLPLIAHAIKTAQASSLIDSVYVSTDDSEIAKIALDYGANIPFLRPAELASDDASEWLAWQHAVAIVHQEKPFDIFVSIPTTAPLRKVSDINDCIALYQTKQADVVITVTEAKRNPYFNMVTLNQLGQASIVNGREKVVESRQAAPKMYDMTTVAYVTRPDFIMKHQGLFDGKVYAAIIPEERAIDIDSELDFKIAEFLYRNQ